MCPRVSKESPLCPAPWGNDGVKARYRRTSSTPPSAAQGTEQDRGGWEEFCSPAGGVDNATWDFSAAEAGLSPPP